MLRMRDYAIPSMVIALIRHIFLNGVQSLNDDGGVNETLSAKTMMMYNQFLGHQTGKPLRLVDARWKTNGFW